ncbi:MAG: 4Fe-4S dicluster domain-containing protein [Spirochaetes bacterium]|nr:4Fe-4S dicluster domain-containing protein [Spirochaetota bacterium]
MTPQVLEARNFAALVEALRRAARLFAPVADPAGGTMFAEVSAATDIALVPANTRLSVKSVFFPQREVLLSFKDSGLDAVPAVDGSIVVLGARPCDARAMTWMDGVFGGGGREDPYFIERRRGAVVIARACDEPCATCFCTSVGGSPYGTKGSDVLASPARGGPETGTPDLLLEPVTEKGAAFLEKHAALLRPAGEGEVTAREARARAAEARMKVLDFSGVKEKMDVGFDSPAWETITRSCLGCGACTYVCPTCHCFDITDESHGERGVRIRTWDGCQYAQFTLHASGHNPRSHKQARMRQRLMHKYSYAPETAGAVFCSGCGRCVRACPVNLDIRGMLHALKDLP